MRLVAAVVVGVAAVAAVTAAPSAEPRRSACGQVGDRERVSAPDGSGAAYVRCTRDGAAWLFVADGKRSRRLVPASYGCCYRPSSRVVFRSPAWSPDSRRLAVVIEDVGGTDVWAIDLATRAARRLTSGPAHERNLRWSADGRRVGFDTETGKRAWVAAG